jgi:hypothetical protein
MERNSWEEMGVRAHHRAYQVLDPPPGHVVARAIVDGLMTGTYDVKEARLLV